MADDRRLSVEKMVSEGIIERIDKTDFLGLGNKGESRTERTDLFIFAMALGVKSGKRTPLSNSIGIIRNETLNNDHKAVSLINSVVVDEMRRISEEQKIANKDIFYDIAEEYANTGFRIINDWIDKTEEKSYDEEAFIAELLSEMTEKYHSI